MIKLTVNQLIESLNRIDNKEEEVNIEDLQDWYEYEVCKHPSNDITLKSIAKSGLTQEEYMDRFFIMFNGTRMAIKDNAERNNNKVTKSFMMFHQLLPINITASFDGKYGFEE